MFLSSSEMSIEQAVNIAYCFKLKITFIKIFKLINKFMATIVEFTRFKTGCEVINDNFHVGQPKFVIAKARHFLKILPKLSLAFMEMELEMFKDSTYYILTAHLSYCAHFVLNKLTTKNCSESNKTFFTIFFLVT